MAKNIPNSTTPLWWTFFFYSALNSSKDIVPLCRLRGTNVDHGDSKWVSSWTDYETNLSLTRPQKIAKRWADQIEYCKNTLGCTSNSQISIMVQLTGSFFVGRDPSDALSNVGESSSWNNATLKHTNGVANIISFFGDPFAELATELSARSVGLSPGFLFMDVETEAEPWYFLGGNALGTHGNGNLDDQMAQPWWATDIMLHVNPDAAKGGGSDRTAEDVTVHNLSPYNVNSDWRGTTNLDTSRELFAINYMTHNAGMDVAFYQNARAAFPNANGLGVHIHCGNYRVVCFDHPAFPLRGLQAYGAVDGSQGEIYPEPSMLTDYYCNCHYPVFYPPKTYFESDPNNIDFGPHLHYYGEDGRSMFRNIIRANVFALKNSSIFSANRSIPQIQWPNIGNGYNGNFSNGYNYGHHTEDFEWVISYSLTSGIYRGIIWGWNPVISVGGDTLTLTTSLDNAYSSLGISGGVL